MAALAGVARGQALVFSGAGAVSASGGERAILFSGGRYFVFFDDGTGVAYASTNDGTSFTARVAASTTTENQGFSVAKNGSTVGLVWANFASPNYTIYYRSGTFSGTSITWNATQTVATSSTDYRGYHPSLGYSSTGTPYIATADYNRPYNGTLSGCGSTRVFRPVHYFFDGTTWQFRVECRNSSAGTSSMAFSVAQSGSNMALGNSCAGTVGDVLANDTTVLGEPWALIGTASVQAPMAVSFVESWTTATDVHLAYLDKNVGLSYCRQDGTNASSASSCLDITTIDATGTWPSLARPTASTGCYTIAYVDGTTLRRRAFSGSITSLSAPNTFATRSATPSSFVIERDAALTPAVLWQEGPAIYFGFATDANPAALTATPATAPADGTSKVTITSTAFRDACGAAIGAGTEVTISSTAGTITSADIDAALPGIQIAAATGGTISFQLQAPSSAQSATVSAMPTTGGPAASVLVTFGTVPLGAVCTAGTQCVSTFCSPAYDGSPKSYCTSAQCTACQGGNSSGACVNALAGTNPNNFCAKGASAVCIPGTCNGMNACAQATAGTDCGSFCSTTTETARQCDASGVCQSTSASCCPYACGAVGCNTGCALDSDCCLGAHCVFGACKNGVAPAITSTANLTASAFAPYDYSTATQDRVVASGTAPVRFAVVGPAGISIDPLLGRLYWEPTMSGMASITVTASNPWGTATQPFTVVVGAPQPPAIAHDANATAQVGTAYVYNAAGALTVTGAVPMSFSKVAGPAEIAVEPASGRVDWVPAAAGNVTVSVRATNAYGADTYTFAVAVSPAGAHAAPNAIAVATPPIGPAPLSVSLDSTMSTAASGATILARSWTFGDGTPPSTAALATHVYQHGAYVARLVVQDSFGASATASVGIQASLGGVTPPLVQIAANPSAGAAPLTVAFSCNCAQAAGARLLWDFGDGNQATTAAPMHVYSAPGGYHVTLTALDDSSGELGVDSVDIAVSDGGKQPPSVRAFADPVTGDAPLSVQFASQLSDPDGRVVSFAWSLGEGDSATDASPVKTFTTPGVYHVELRAVDNDGLQTTSSVDVQVTTGGVLPPHLLSKAASDGQVGVPWLYGDGGRPQARGGRPLTWRLGKTVNGVEMNHPAGMTIDPATGAIAWTPTAAQSGPQPVTLLVQNAAGVDFQDFVVEVGGAAKGGGCGCTVGRADDDDGDWLARFAVAAVALALAMRRRRCV